MGGLSILHILILTLLITINLHSTISATPPTKSSHSLIKPHTNTTRNLTTDSGDHHLPAGGTKYRHIVGDSLRVVSPFQLCASCNCCSADDPSNCSWMPCCFGIDCDLPGKPFGLCSFVPKYCNCTSCA